MKDKSRQVEEVDGRSGTDRGHAILTRGEDLKQSPVYEKNGGRPRIGPSRAAHSSLDLFWDRAARAADAASSSLKKRRIRMGKTGKMEEFQRK